jgi:hypothetical protein
MTKIITGLVLLLLTSSVIFGQTTSAAPSESHAKEELRKLFVDLNEALAKRDRAALERIYADDFQFVHTTGGVIDKTTQINNALANDRTSTGPLAIPTFDGLLLFGDVAIFRTLERGVAGTNIYSRKEGRWQIVQVQGTRLPPDRKPITLDPKVLDAYLGKYEFAPGAYATVTKDGDALSWKPGNRAKSTLIPLTDSKFYSKENDAEMTFSKDEKGQVTGVVLRLGVCQESKAKKIE